MTTPSNRRSSNLQPARVPKLAYRKPLSEDEAAKHEERLDDQLRQQDSKQTTAARSNSTWESVNKPSVLPSSSTMSKKKNSIFGGLFVKEPTIMALAAVEADLKAKHGAATPQKVPHVSSRKMPEHVPKVNSKWDGVPEAVKLREQEEKQRRRTSQRSSVLSSQPVRFPSEDDVASGVCRVQPATTTSGSDTTSQVGSNGYGRPESFCSSVSADSTEKRTRPPPSVHAQSLRSPSGSSLPEITSFFPHHQQEHGPTLSVPQQPQSLKGASVHSTVVSQHSQPDSVQSRYHGNLVEVVPEHSSSPVTTPTSEPPATPCDDSSEPDKAIVYRVKRSSRIKPIDGFLAGEAQPFEIKDDNNTSHVKSDLPLRQYQQARIGRVETDIAKRPDTSRDRLGLRASMIVNTEAVPWEIQDPHADGPRSPGSASKGRFIPKFR
ncbi:hypothetical protein LTS08_004379 [Lithohypha guttulata]|nr:hypothetical protein LTS08_004379 [Lithohypha guttulata]